MTADGLRRPRGPWYTALVRAPSIAVGVCALGTLITGGGPLAWLCGLPLAPALAAVHATGDGARPRRVVMLAAVATVAAAVALLALLAAVVVAITLLLEASDFD